MSCSLIRQAAVVASIAVPLIGCSATPSVTSPAQGKVFEVLKAEPKQSGIAVLGFDLFSITRHVQTRFWVFAEDGIGFVFDPSDVGSQHNGEPYIHWVTPSSPDLTGFAEVNGLPVAVHLGHLLVSTSPSLHWRDYGPIADGETIEFTASGILVDGRYRGALPGP